MKYSVMHELNYIVDHISTQYMYAVSLKSDQLKQGFCSLFDGIAS